MSRLETSYLCLQEAGDMDSGGGGGGSLHENCVHLSKLDIPGASLKGRNPADLTIPQLKRWLQCRDAPTKGKKGDLVAW